MACSHGLTNKPNLVIGTFMAVLLQGFLVGRYLLTRFAQLKEEEWSTFQTRNFMRIRLGSHTA